MKGSWSRPRWSLRDRGGVAESLKPPDGGGDEEAERDARQDGGGFPEGAGIHEPSVSAGRRSVVIPPSTVAYSCRRRARCGRGGRKEA